MGTLLGEYEKGVLNITNCYAVPFEEDQTIWFLDHVYHEDMYGMFRKINAKEKIVGWYCSGTQIKKNDIEIHEKYRLYNTNPVFVVTNVQESDQLSIPTKAFCSIEEIDEESEIVKSNFVHVPSSIDATLAEKIGVEHLLRDIKDVSIGDLSKQVSNKILGLKALVTKIDDMKVYLEQVINGELPMNAEILHNLQDIFNLLPNLNYEDIIKSFSVKTNDFMHMTYVCSLIRSVIGLHNVINNKLIRAGINVKKEEAKEEEKKDEKEKEKKEKEEKEEKKDSKA